MDGRTISRTEQVVLWNSRGLSIVNRFFFGTRAARWYEIFEKAVTWATVRFNRVRKERKITIVKGGSSIVITFLALQDFSFFKLSSFAILCEIHPTRQEQSVTIPGLGVFRYSFSFPSIQNLARHRKNIYFYSLTTVIFSRSKWRIGLSQLVRSDMIILCKQVRNLFSVVLLFVCHSGTCA